MKIALSSKLLLQAGSWKLDEIIVFSESFFESKSTLWEKTILYITYQNQNSGEKENKKES